MTARSDISWVSQSVSRSVDRPTQTHRYPPETDKPDKDFMARASTPTPSAIDRRDMGTRA